MRSDVYAQILTDALVHNFRALRARLASGVRLCAPLKADAYGHGVSIVAPILYREGADYAAVATVPEALELRGTGWDRPILLLGNVLAVADERERTERLEAMVRHRLTVTVVDHSTIDLLAAVRTPEPLNIHLKVDTGMGRMGVMPEDAIALVKRIRACPLLRITGIYSHFATADFENLSMVHHQCAVFREVLTALGDYLPRGIIRHLANSAGTIALSDVQFDMVRPGLALYGYAPSDHLARQIDLRPSLRLMSHLSAVKQLPAGHCVGYGQTFTTARPTRLGIVPIGYFDGFIRALSNNAWVSIGGVEAPVIGRISMDQMAVDLTDLPPQPVGAPVTLIHPDPAKPNSVAAIARRLGTIPYEVTCLLGKRIDRVAAGGYWAC